MRCIFCKQDSSTSKSVEHIIPESIGNKSSILQPGIVCDKCNNYFSREIEKPFLENKSIQLLRFEEAIYSKKGKIPTMQGYLNGRYPVVVHKEFKNGLVGHVDVPIGDAFNSLMNIEKGTIILPKFTDELPLPSGSIMSRFLGKIALEYMAKRLEDYPEGIAYLVDEAQLDVLRNHVRRGTNKNWPCNIRRIYDMDKIWVDEYFQQYQIVNECDFLITDNGEWYFVLALFGIEFVINIGGPEITGYLLWLKNHNNRSPLYYGKNDK